MSKVSPPYQYATTTELTSIYGCRMATEGAAEVTQVSMNSHVNRVRDHRKTYRPNIPWK